MGSELLCKNWRHFSCFSLEQKDARGERKEQYARERKNKKNIKEVTFSVLLLFCVTLP